MIRILLCCGGGFSSSYLTVKMQNEIKDKNLQDEVLIDFYPFKLVDEKIGNYDILMCCPHLNFEMKRYVKAHHPKIPFYLLPPRMYGLMSFDELYQDAKDVIKEFKQTKMNPFHFPGEENNLRIERSQAYYHIH